MTSQAKMEANRRNAQKSTGPRTPEGKARVSLNALKHGIRARAMVDQLQRTPLWDEEPQEFAALVQSLTDCFTPEGPYEEMCVEDIAINQWRLRRLARVETGHIATAQRQVPGSGRDNPALRARASLPDLDTLEKLTRYEVTIRRMLNRSLETLTRLQTQRAAVLSAPKPDLPSPDPACPPTADHILSSTPSTPSIPSTPSTLSTWSTPCPPTDDHPSNQPCPTPAHAPSPQLDPSTEGDGALHLELATTASPPESDFDSAVTDTHDLPKQTQPFIQSTEGPASDQNQWLTTCRRYSSKC